MSPRSAKDQRPPLIAGRYRLRSPIGRGGMGQVWRARDKVLDRDVAVKEMGGFDGRDGSESSTRYERARREARTAARIDHPNVVRIYDVVHQDGRLWIVMELVTGRTLAELVRDSGPLPAADVVHIGLGLATALRQVHAAGVLHRDVKPANVILTPGGRVVLMDFGIAVAWDQSDTTLTSTGVVIGTVGYLAPERVRGLPPGPAADLWSLGATLYHAVTGHDPFERRTSAIAVLAAVLSEEVEVDASAGPLRPLLTALLRKDPEVRPTVDEVIHELTALTEPGSRQPGETAREPAAAPNSPLGPTTSTVTAPHIPSPDPAPTHTSVTASRPPAPRPDPSQPRSYIPRKPATAFAPRHPRPDGGSR